jgi:homoserine kinase
VFSAIHATLLGAGLASGSALLFQASTDDKLHEPYRIANAPHLAAIRSEPPVGYVGATLSGSGSTAIVWAEKARVEETVAELRARFADHEILHLAVTTTGAGSV